MIRRRALVAAAVLVLAIAGLLGYRYLTVDRGMISLPTVEGCLLHREACTTALPTGGAMRIDIEPKQPAPTDPLRIRIEFEQVTPSMAGVRLKGVNMNMGYLEHFVYELTREPGASAPVVYSGSAGVFACSTTVMQWLVLTQVEIDGQRYEIPFRFETRQK